MYQRRTSRVVRYATFVLEPEAGFHPANTLLASEPSITRVAIYHIHRLPDGTLVLLYELHGDLDRACDVLSGHSDVISCEITGEEEGLAYLQGRPTPSVVSLFEFVDRSRLVLEMPLRHVEGGVQFTFVGDEQAVGTAVDAIPDDYSATIVGTGDYEPTQSSLFAKLTRRQRAVLSVASEQGYYDIPRETTQEQIAQELEVTPETVNEHLRKIESKILPRIIR